MSVNDDEFWDWLRDEVAQANTPQADELAAAEALLQEIEREGAEPLGADRIDEMVANATGEPPRDEDAPPAPVHRFAPARRMLAAAAAVLVAPKFLVAATAVTAIAVTAMLLQHTTQSLPFRDAVSMMLDDEYEESDRMLAQGRVFFDVIETMTLVQQLREAGAMAGPAQTSLARMRDALDDDSPFLPSSSDEPLAVLRERAASSAFSAAAQQDAIEALTDQAVYGISALVQISRSSGPADLLRHNAVHLHNIRSLAAK